VTRLRGRAALYTWATADWRIQTTAYSDEVKEKVRSVYMGYSGLADTDRKLKVPSDGWVDGWVGGWMDGWADGWFGGWVDWWWC
jgi:hypothetical protein